MIFHWMRKVSVTTPYKQSLLPLPFWVRRRKGGSTWIASTFEVTAAQTSELINLLLNRSGLFECEYPLFDKAMVTIEPARASARLLDLNYILATCDACSTKILFDSCSLSQASFFSPCELSLLLLSFLMRRRRGGSAWIASNLWGRRSPNRSLSEFLLRFNIHLINAIHLSFTSSSPQIYQVRQNYSNPATLR